MEATLNSSLGRTILGSEAIRIGRAADNALALQDSQASTRHVEVAPSFDGNGYQVTDLGSTNGTFVNEQRLAPSTPYILKPGDVIRIGQTRITYEVSSAAYAPTVAASASNYPPTAPDLFAQPASSSNYPPTAPDAFPQPAQAAFQQPPSYGNFNTPAQPPYTPPQTYPQPTIFAQPPAPPSYSQPGSFAQAPAPPPYPQPGNFEQQQAAYPQVQPAYAPPGYAPPGFGPIGTLQRRNNTGLIIAGVVILVLLIIGGTSIYLVSRSTPEKTLGNYCDALKTGNGQELYDNLDAAGQLHSSVALMQQYVNDFSGSGGLRDCVVGSVQENGSSASGTVTLTGNNGQSATQTFTLIQENGTWKIDTVR